MQDTRSRYDAISRWYDLLTGFGEGRARNFGLEMLRVREGETILEIGCGTGQALLPIARSLGERGSLYALDLSRGMLARAQARIARLGCPQRVKLLVGDARCLPVSSDHFDSIWMSFTLELFSASEIALVLAECRRALAPGGKLCIVALSRKAECSSISKLYDRLHAKFPQWVDCCPIHVQALLLQARFDLQEVKEISLWGLPVEIVLVKKT